MYPDRIKLFLFLTLTCMGFLSCQKESAFRFPAKPQVTIDAKRVIENNIHLVKDTVYILAVNLDRDSGQSLKIDAGTLIKVNGLVAITIHSGARIEATGTATDPIIFTSSEYTGSQGRYLTIGNWNGLRVYGNQSGEGSGILSFVRIEFAGTYSSAVLLSGVNNHTQIDHIEVSYSFNQTSVELDGGNCNISHLITYASAGTDLLIRNGYTGLMQNVLLYRHPFYAVGTNLTGLYITDYPTRPRISNLTVIGPDTRYGLAPDYSLGAPQQRAALIVTGSSLVHIRNSAFIDFPLHTFYVNNYNSNDSLDKFISDISYTTFFNTDSSKIFFLEPASYPGYNSIDMRNFFMWPQFVNKILTDRKEFMMSDAYNYYDGVPNPLPMTGSPLLSGADFNSDLYKDPFFEKVQYVGAVGENNWLQGWTNFIPLQTNYNN